MASLTYVKPVPIMLKGHPAFNETWLRDRTEEDPSILGLGDNVEVRDVERSQPKAGRLDLLLCEPETGKRYEVELVLGKERKRIMLHLKKDDLDQNREVLKELYEVAYQEWFE